jgi:hypothetical protein
MKRALLLPTALIIGCGASEDRMPPEPTPRRIPDITSETEEGFHDLLFGVGAVDNAADGSTEVTAIGILQGQDVGFQAVLPPTWKEGRLADSSSFRGIVTIRSLGSKSDLLVKALDSIYGVRLEAVKMVDAVHFAAITLKGNPSQLAADEVAIKLFFGIVPSDVEKDRVRQRH